MECAPYGQLGFWENWEKHFFCLKMSYFNKIKAVREKKCFRNHLMSSLSKDKTIVVRFRNKAYSKYVLRTWDSIVYVNSPLVRAGTFRLAFNERWATVSSDWKCLDGCSRSSGARLRFLWTSIGNFRHVDLSKHSRLADKTWRQVESLYISDSFVWNLTDGRSIGEIQMIMSTGPSKRKSMQNARIDHPDYSITNDRSKSIHRNNKQRISHDIHIDEIVQSF